MHRAVFAAPLSQAACPSLPFLSQNLFFAFPPLHLWPFYLHLGEQTGPRDHQPSKLVATKRKGKTSRAQTPSKPKNRGVILLWHEKLLRAC